jgi:hypothetical protein
MVLMVSVIFAQKFKTLCRLLGKRIALLLHVKEIERILWQREAPEASRPGKPRKAAALRSGAAGDGFIQEVPCMSVRKKAR